MTTHVPAGLLERAGLPATGEGLDGGRSSLTSTPLGKHTDTYRV
jgi:hypothetical protein